MDDVGRIKLPQTLENASCRHDETAFQHHLSVEDRGNIATDEYEQVGRAAETEIPQRQQTDCVVRDVIQKQKPGRDAEQKTEPEIAVACGNHSLH